MSRAAESAANCTQSLERAVRSVVPLRRFGDEVGADHPAARVTGLARDVGRFVQVPNRACLEISVLAVHALEMERSESCEVFDVATHA